LYPYGNSGRQRVNDSVENKQSVCVCTDGERCALRVCRRLWRGFTWHSDGETGCRVADMLWRRSLCSGRQKRTVKRRVSAARPARHASRLVFRLVCWPCSSRLGRANHFMNVFFLERFGNFSWMRFPRFDSVRQGEWRQLQPHFVRTQTSLMEMKHFMSM